MRFATRRTLCRWIFCLAGLVPTMLVTGAAIVVHTPMYAAARKAAWQARLAARLGLEVDIGRLETMRGARWVLHKLELRDPESHRWLFRARSVEAVSTAEWLLIVVNQGELDAQKLTRLGALFHEHVLSRGTEGPAIEIQADPLTLRRSDHAESLLAVRCRLKGDHGGTEVLVSFRLPGSDPEQPARLRFVRNRQLDPPATGWELHTGKTALPCTLAAAWLRPLSALGDDGTFAGSVWAEQGPDGWDAEIQGVFRQVDLDRLVTRHFPHKLSGFAEVEIRRGTIHQGRIVEMIGSLRSDGGVVSQSLLEAARASFGFKLYDRSGGAMRLRYKQLGFSFALDSKRLAFGSRIESSKTVLDDRDGPLLALGDPGPLQPIALLRLLVPQSELSVPATSETALMVSILPMPEIVPPTTRSARTPDSPLRLRVQ